MGHTYSLSTVRFIGYVLAKLLRQLYQGVAINNPGILKVLSLHIFFTNMVYKHINISAQ